MLDPILKNYKRPDLKVPNLHPRNVCGGTVPFKFVCRDCGMDCGTFAYMQYHKKEKCPFRYKYKKDIPDLKDYKHGQKE